MPGPISPNEIAAMSRATPGRPSTASAPSEAQSDKPGGFDLFSMEGLKQNALPLGLAAIATALTGGAGAIIAAPLLAARANEMSGRSRQEFEESRKFYLKILDRMQETGDTGGFEALMRDPAGMKPFKKYGIDEDQVKALAAATYASVAGTRSRMEGGLLRGIDAGAEGDAMSGLSPTELDAIFNPKKVGERAQLQPLRSAETSTELLRGDTEIARAEERRATAALRGDQGTAARASAAESLSGIDANRALAELRRAKVKTEKVTRQKLKRGSDDLIKLRVNTTKELTGENFKLPPRDAARVANAIMSNTVEELEPRLRDKAIAAATTKSGQEMTIKARSQTSRKAASDKWASIGKGMTGSAGKGPTMSPNEAVATVRSATNDFLGALKLEVDGGLITPEAAAEEARETIRVFVPEGAGPDIDDGWFVDSKSKSDTVSLKDAYALGLAGAAIPPIDEVEAAITQTFGAQSIRAQGGAPGGEAAAIDALMKRLAPKAP